MDKRYIDVEAKRLRTSNTNRPLPVPIDHSSIYETMPDDHQKTAAVNPASCNTSTPDKGNTESSVLVIHVQRGIRRHTDGLSGPHLARDTRTPEEKVGGRLAALTDHATSSVTAVLPPPVQRCGTVCLNSFGNRTSPLDNLNDRLKRLCLVSRVAAPCVRTLRAPTRHLLAYLLTYVLQIVVQIVKHGYSRVHLLYIYSKLYKYPTSAQNLSVVGHQK